MYRRTHQLIALAMIAAGSVTVSSISQAQGVENVGDQRMKGFMFGAHSVAAQGVDISNPDIALKFTTGFGTGGGVTIGYGFNRYMTGFVSLDVAKQEATQPEFKGDVGLVHGEVGLRANLAVGRASTVPYLTAAVGGRAIGAKLLEEGVDEEYGMTISGGLFAFGAGIEQFFSRSTALDVGVSFGMGEFDKFKTQGTEVPLPTRPTRSIRARVGVTWHP
jgi:hypothetical protein